MKAYWKVLGLGLVGSFLATACVISTDDDGGFDFDDDGGDSTPDATPPTDAGTDPSDAADSSVSAPDADSGQDMCVGPSDGACATCITAHCLPEFCACDADSDCGDPVEGELLCLNICLQEASDQGVSQAEAFEQCGMDCAYNAGILAESTNTLVNCMMAGVPDELFADSGIDGGLIAVCGFDCFGYLEPGSE